MKPHADGTHSYSAIDHLLVGWRIIGGAVADDDRRSHSGAGGGDCGVLFGLVVGRSGAGVCSDVFIAGGGATFADWSNLSAVFGDAVDGGSGARAFFWRVHLGRGGAALRH